MTIPKELLRRIDGLLSDGEHHIIAIDGRCASGKTTLAAALRERYGCEVAHMDHFFLRPEQRTPERLNTPGENVDHERFREEVLLPLVRGETVTYRPFDCARQELGEAVTLRTGGLTIVEGSYPCHRELWAHYDLRIFLTVDPEEQMRRIISRNGDRAQSFRDKWIPLEEAYFSAFDLEKQCDITIYHG